jgi:hypothetical protein
VAGEHCSEMQFNSKEPRKNKISYDGALEHAKLDALMHDTWTLDVLMFFM